MIMTTDPIKHFYLLESMKYEPSIFSGGNRNTNFFDKNIYKK